MSAERLQSAIADNSNATAAHGSDSSSRQNGTVLTPALSLVSTGGTKTGVSLPSDVKLFDTKELKQIENLADFYALIQTTEMIEGEYSSGSISIEDYHRECNNLISQFKIMESALKISHAIVSTEQFIRDNNMDCPRALDRLLRAGVPATALTSASSSLTQPKIISDTTQAFITAMDALALGQRAMDEIHGLINEIVSNLAKLHGFAGFYGSVKMQEWLNKLHAMRAHEELNDEDIRQLTHDLQTSYEQFKEKL